MKEGPVLIPPITGQFLFHSLHAKSDEVQLPYVENARNNREGYSEATLARVIRQGIDSDKARAIVKAIKVDGPKGVQVAIQGDTVRVSSKKRDDLHTVIGILRGGDFGLPLQCENYR